MARKYEIREERSLGDPPENLKNLVGWLGEIVQSVPEGCRDTASVELSTYGDYDGGVTRDWTLIYWRGETEEEKAKRIARTKRLHEAAKIANAKAAEKKAADERALYEELKRKFA